MIPLKPYADFSWRDSDGGAHFVRTSGNNCDDLRAVASSSDSNFSVVDNPIAISKNAHVYRTNCSKFADSGFYSPSSQNVLMDALALYNAIFFLLALIFIVWRAAKWIPRIFPQKD